MLKTLAEGFAKVSYGVEEQDGEAPHASNKDIPAKGLPEKKDGKKEVSHLFFHCTKIWPIWWETI